MSKPSNKNEQIPGSKNDDQKTNEDLTQEINDLQDQLSEEKENAAADKEKIATFQNDIADLKKLVEERNKLAAQANDKQEEEEPEESSSFLGWIIAIVLFLVVGVIGFFHLTTPKPEKQKVKTPENGDENNSPALF